MNRRESLLAIGSTTLLAGCADRLASATESEEKTEPPEGVSQNVQIDGNECVDEPQHTATASFDESETKLTIEGTVATHKPCLRLAIAVKDGAGESDRNVDDVRIDVTVQSPEESEDCDRCPSEIEYFGRVTFDAVPASIDVFHHDTDENEFVGPVDSV